MIAAVLAGMLYMAYLVCSRMDPLHQLHREERRGVWPCFVEIDAGLFAFYGVICSLITIVFSVGVFAVFWFLAGMHGSFRGSG